MILMLAFHLMYILFLYLLLYLMIRFRENNSLDINHFLGVLFYEVLEL